MLKGSYVGCGAAFSLAVLFLMSACHDTSFHDAGSMSGRFDSGNKDVSNDRVVSNDASISDSAVDLDAKDAGFVLPDGAWSSEIFPPNWKPGPTDRFWAHDFSYAGYRDGRALPQMEGPVFRVEDFGALPNGEDATAGVQDAIAAASEAGGGVVLFGRGEYTFYGTVRIENNGVVLRGKGAAETKLRHQGDQRFFMEFAGDSSLGESNYEFSDQLYPERAYPLSEDGKSRSHEVRISNASSLRVGQRVSVGWNISPAFVAEHKMDGTWKTFNGKWKPFFRRRIVALDPEGTTTKVTLDVPLRYRARTRDGAALLPTPGYLRECGLESMAISNAFKTRAEALPEQQRRKRYALVRFRHVADSWVDQVESYHPEGVDSKWELRSRGIVIEESVGITVQNSTLRYPQNYDEGGNGYLFEVSKSNEILFYRSTAVGGRHNFTVNWDFGSSGCVWLECESREGKIRNNGLTGVGYSDFHHSLAMANLVDSSQIEDGWKAENRGDFSSGAGHTATETVFWNNRGGGEILSRQFGNGYLVGNQNPIRTTLDLSIVERLINSKAAQGTEPEDRVESSESKTLWPASLYEEQRRRRITSP